jgi:short-subunit dehydrogenase
MRDLSGRNALLTGASRGIGVFIGEALARQDVNLAICARPPSSDQLSQVAEKLANHGVRVVPILADLNFPQDRIRLVQETLNQLGPIDLLINNAGMEYSSPFIQLDNETVWRITEVNLIAPMDLTRLVLPGMLEQREGHIVNISSMSGKSPIALNSIYSATKAGMIAWTWAVRSELAGSGVSISVVCPGFVSEVGMHARSGDKAPGIAREVSPQKVAKKVIDAIRFDRVETLVWATPVRPLLAIKELFPGFALWFYDVSGIDRFVKREETKTG